MQSISDAAVCDAIVIFLNRDTTNIVSSHTLYGTTMVTPPRTMSMVIWTTVIWTTVIVTTVIWMTVIWTTAIMTTAIMTTAISLPSRFTTMNMYMKLTII